MKKIKNIFSKYNDVEKFIILSNLFKVVVFAIILGGCSMMMAGCSTQPKYIDGSDLAVGVYIPAADNIVGVQFLHYLNGVKV